MLASSFLEEPPQFLVLAELLAELLLFGFARRPCLALGFVVLVTVGGPLVILDTIWPCGPL